MNNIFWTSDPHYYHSNIIKFCKRPFSSVEEMNEVMIERWNSKIKPQDIVYLLGDFSFGNVHQTEELLKRLNGNIHLCRGNHDRPLNNLHHYFSSVFDLKTIKIEDSCVEGGYQFIQMCHYPLLSFDRQYYKSIHLHGHCHNNIPFDPLVRRIDVGVDKWDFYPVSYDEIQEYLRQNYKGI